MGNLALPSIISLDRLFGLRAPRWASFSGLFTGTLVACANQREAQEAQGG